MVFNENKDGRQFYNLKGTSHNKRTNIVKRSEETCSLILTPGAHQFIDISMPILQTNACSKKWGYDKVFKRNRILPLQTMPNVE